MCIVYILVSKQYPDRIYIGLTENIAQRVIEHNTGRSSYSRKYGPWELVTYTTFSHKKKAIEFEKYLKSGSGFAFLKKHYI
jgi:putative endonuclease